jgi:GH25 family lysozyme M1 (1,4-beta-N-acetylmuramidase)
MTILGVDFASVDENKPVDWAAAKAAGCRFAVMRSHYGEWPDPAFPREWPRAREAGVVRVAYLFLRFELAQDALRQARAVCREVALEPGDWPVSLDVEFAAARPPTLTARDVLDQFVLVAREVLRDHYGCEPLVYTSAREWSEGLDDLPAPDLVDCPAWLAAYPFPAGPWQRPNAERGPARTPRPWPGEPWVWQYQGNATDFPGFSSSFDMNVFNSLAEGATGPRVAWTQRRIGTTPDGVFGPETASTLRAWQAARGLAPDGIVGPASFGYLARTSSSASSVPSSSSTSSDVTGQNEMV